MKIRCLHGYFIFEETRVSQVSDFMRYTSLEIVPKGLSFTFEDLENAPRYSIVGKTLSLGKTPIPAIASHEGEPWEVFEANQIVYDFVLGTIRPIQSVTAFTEILNAGNRYVSNGLILPGSLTVEGKRVKDYAAWYSRDTKRFLYSEVTYV